MNGKLDFSDAVVLGYYENFGLTWCIASTPHAVQQFDDYLQEMREDGEALYTEELQVTLYDMPITVYAYHPFNPIDMLVIGRSLADYADHLQSVDSDNFHDKPFDFTVKP